MARTGRIAAALSVLCLLIEWMGTVAHAEAADLHANTLAAFDRYVQLTEARIDDERRGTLPFLWIEGLPELQRR